MCFEIILRVCMHLNYSSQCLEAKCLVKKKHCI